MVRIARFSAILALVLSASPTWAQTPYYNPDIEVVQQAAAFSVFAEPGAPTIDVMLVNLGGSSALFRVGEETTLTQMLALSGGIAGTEENDRVIIRQTVSVLRDDGNGGRSVVYSAEPEQLFREPGRHPQLRSGDVVEIDSTYETVRERLTVREGIQIVASIASLVSTIILIAIRI